jgi:hypothetical protein
MAFFWERTYKDLLGSLDGSKNDVCAECLFVDPVADIAVLGCPDEQEMGQRAEAYHELVDEAPAIRIGKPRSGRAWVLTLHGHWTPTPVKVSGLYGTSLSIGPTLPGMSGSPILNDAGRAVGLVAIGGETISKGKRQQMEMAMQGPQPILSRDLPARFIG